MMQSRCAASSLVAITVFLAVGFAWGADPPTLEELAAGIDRVRTGPDGERVVAGHISRKLAVSVEVLRAQRARTGLDWGDLLVANLLCKTKEPTAPVAELEQVETGGMGIDEGIVIGTFLLLVCAIVLVYFASEAYRLPMAGG